jgi:hypothetical protein
VAFTPGALLKQGLQASALWLALPWLTPSADAAATPLLLQSPQSNNFEPTEVDAAFPRGHRVHVPPRPNAGTALCSGRRSVCVHMAPNGAGAATVLTELEDAYDQMVLALRLPAPLPDSGGPSPALDLYVLDDSAEFAAYAERSLAREDHAPGYCVVGSRNLDRTTAARCLAEASLLGTDAAETPAIRRGMASALSWSTAPAELHDLDAVDAAQRNPQHGLLARDRNSTAAAGALFWGYLEGRYGSGRPGELLLSVLQQSRSITEPGSLEWLNEPDVLDVVRNGFDNSASRFADVAIDFAVSRLFLGERADGLHPPNAAWLGAEGRVRFDWSVAFSSLPRNLAGVYPLDPLGSTYVWLDLAGVPANSDVTASFAWEAPVRFKWNIVAIDAEGRELRRFDVPYFEQGSQIERSVLTVPGAVGLVFVGINLGGVSAEYPFDPDHEPWEPHAYELYLAAL